MQGNELSEIYKIAHILLSKSLMIICFTVKCNDYMFFL